MSARQQALGNQAFALLPSLAITTAIGVTTGAVALGLAATKYLIVQAAFTYGSGGTNVDAYVQTSLDLGQTWVDIMEFNFLVASITKISAVVWSTALAAVTVPGDGALTANTIVSGLLGDRFRLKYKSTGTYAATTLAVTAVAKG